MRNPARLLGLLLFCTMGAAGCADMTDEGLFKKAQVHLDALKWLNRDEVRQLGPLRHYRIYLANGTVVGRSYPCPMADHEYFVVAVILNSDTELTGRQYTNGVEQTNWQVEVALLAVKDGGVAPMGKVIILGGDGHTLRRGNGEHPHAQCVHFWMIETTEKIYRTPPGNP